MPASTIILPAVTRHNVEPDLMMDPVYAEDKVRIAYGPRTRRQVKAAAHRRTRRAVNQILSTAAGYAL